MRWRTGRKVGSTIYLQHGDEPSDEDELIGVMFSPERAAAAVDAYNRSLLRADTVAAEPWVPSAWEFIPTPRARGEVGATSTLFA